MTHTHHTNFLNFLKEWWMDEKHAIYLTAIIIFIISVVIGIFTDWR